MCFERRQSDVVWGLLACCRGRLVAAALARLSRDCREVAGAQSPAVAAPEPGTGDDCNLHRNAFGRGRSLLVVNRSEQVSEQDKTAGSVGRHRSIQQRVFHLLPPCSEFTSLTTLSWVSANSSDSIATWMAAWTRISACSAFTRWVLGPLRISTSTCRWRVLPPSSRPGNLSVIVSAGRGSFFPAVGELAELPGHGLAGAGCLPPAVAGRCCPGDGVPCFPLLGTRGVSGSGVSADGGAGVPVFCTGLSCSNEDRAL